MSSEAFKRLDVASQNSLLRTFLKKVFYFQLTSMKFQINNASTNQKANHNSSSNTNDFSHQVHRFSVDSKWKHENKITVVLLFCLVISVRVWTSEFWTSEASSLLSPEKIEFIVERMKSNRYILLNFRMIRNLRNIKICLPQIKFKLESITNFFRIASFCKMVKT